jgi:hypothetical protein
MAMAEQRAQQCGQLSKEQGSDPEEIKKSEEAMRAA